VYDQFASSSKMTGDLATGGKRVVVTHRTNGEPRYSPSDTATRQNALTAALLEGRARIASACNVAMAPNPCPLVLTERDYRTP